jgi:holo-[acyl-carrier protein] synthase
MTLTALRVAFFNGLIKASEAIVPLSDETDHRKRMAEESIPPPLPRAYSSIIGLGTDIIETVRIGEMIEKHGETFLTRVYTAKEVSYCQQRREYTQHFAGRWAAKEAVMKTLGTGWARGITWTDIEVVTAASGQPCIALHGQAAEIAKERGIAAVLITISHCRAYAVASAIAVS